MKMRKIAEFEKIIESPGEVVELIAAATPGVYFVTAEMESMYSTQVVGMNHIVPETYCGAPAGYTEYELSEVNYLSFAIESNGLGSIGVEFTVRLLEPPVNGSIAVKVLKAEQ